MAAAATTKLAKALGCTERTVRNRLLIGMPRDIDAAKAWVSTHINPKPRKGGKIAGAGRPKGSKNKTQPRGAEVALDRATRLALLPIGGLNKAQIDQTLDETRVIEAVRASELEAGRLVESEEITAAWTEFLAGVKADLDGMATRVEGKAGAQLRLSPEQGKTLRAVVEAEVAEVFKRLVAGEWKKKT